MSMKIGVLSLQGDFKEHIEMLGKCKVDAALVKLPGDLENINGLIIPGGESTAIGNLMQRYGLDNAIIKRHNEGMAVYGTCAGAILLAKNILTSFESPYRDIVGSGQPRLSLLDISIKRNDYGRQIDSFTAELGIENIGRFNGIFIRAPVIEQAGNGIKVLSAFKNKPVLVQKGNILASTFHPELTEDKRVHEYFIGMVKDLTSPLEHSSI